MDMFSPGDPRPIHFMGIGGAGMSALALLAQSRGVPVSGCDPQPAGAADVERRGATVWSAHDPAHLQGVRALVVTAAIPSGHPEIARARELGIPVVPRKEALGALTAAGRTVAIAGTHGKTTTTVMTTEALVAAGLDPTGLAGGRVSGWGGNARPGADGVFVVEADEYDRAFLALHPEVAVVTNIEADHLEVYGTLEAIEEAFAEFAGRAARAVVCSDDPGSARLASRLSVPTWRYGQSPGADLRLLDVATRADGSRAAVQLPDGERVELRLQVPGLHNLRNALAALGAALALGAAPGPVLEGLARFSGVGRRFERVGEVSGVSVIDDYAHHPTEVAATLAAARQAFPGRRLVAVFQPHLYSRTREHGAALGSALAGADVVVVGEIYAAREAPEPGVSGATVADAARTRGARVEFVPERGAIAPLVASLVEPGDVVLTMGAGDITQAGPELLACLTPA